ncbi:hypothetical protein [Pseudomonas synxantha]|uniref:hypothetical protein n=1 Tax=Pseudomonas synxantha TaxID=47883 RepID=UPI00099B7AAA|nr:hypothetical protein [Pseudomonas synxantha]OPB07102.1 hypothetical protein BFW89_08460 [Pseudomonas synxantha]
MNRTSNTLARQQPISTDAVAWHMLSAEQVIERLGVKEQAGLDAAQVQPRPLLTGHWQPLRSCLRCQRHAAVY